VLEVQRICPPRVTIRYSWSRSDPPRASRSHSARRAGRSSGCTYCRNSWSRRSSAGWPVIRSKAGLTKVRRCCRSYATTPSRMVAVTVASWLRAAVASARLRPSRRTRPTRSTSSRRLRRRAAPAMAARAFAERVAVGSGTAGTTDRTFGRGTGPEWRPLSRRYTRPGGPASDPQPGRAAASGAPTARRTDRSSRSREKGFSRKVVPGSSMRCRAREPSAVPET
jgi:hypothetical protein